MKVARVREGVVAAEPATGDRAAVDGGAAGPRIVAVDSRTGFVDLLHMGRRSLIGAGVLELDEGVALVDPGPEARLGTLWAALAEMGYGPAEVRAVLLTHIHLDHATATGAIVRAVPDARVFVHTVGAPHMLDPTRLLMHARRIYGDGMERLWGELLPVPARALRQVEEGSEVRVGGRRLRVADAPGHAKHHVAYFEPETGVAWIGDAGGLRIEDGPTVPVTPPPDVDVEAWNRSMDRITAWRPERIVTTHFGIHDDPEAHFGRLREGLSDWAARVRRSLEVDQGSLEVDPEAQGRSQVRSGDERASGAGPSGAQDGGRAGSASRASDDDAHARAFAEQVRAELCSSASADSVDLYAAMSAFEDSWRGLARYWRKAAPRAIARSPA